MALPRSTEDASREIHLAQARDMFAGPAWAGLPKLVVYNPRPAWRWEGHGPLPMILDWMGRAPGDVIVAQHVEGAGVTLARRAFGQGAQALMHGLPPAFEAPWTGLEMLRLARDMAIEQGFLQGPEQAASIVLISSLVGEGPHGALQALERQSPRSKQAGHGRSLRGFIATAPCCALFGETAAEAERWLDLALVGQVRRKQGAWLATSRETLGPELGAMIQARDLSDALASRPAPIPGLLPLRL